MLLPRWTKSESNITTFEGRRKSFLRFELSKKVESNVAPALFSRGRAFHFCFILCQSEFLVIKYFCISRSRHFAAGLFTRGNLSVSHYWLNVYNHMHMMLFKFGGIHNCLQTILKETTNKFKMVLFEELKILFSKSERLF